MTRFLVFLDRNPSFSLGWIDLMRPGDPSFTMPLRRGTVEYLLCTEADHEAVYQHLLHVFQGTEREAFLGSLSDPAYRPDQRLLVKVNGTIVSHLHLTERLMRFGQTTIPFHGIVKLGTLPEYRGMGLAHNLLKLAEQQSHLRGGAVMALTTASPDLYKSLGWVECGRQTTGQVPSRNLPALGDGVVETKNTAWHVRPWRQVELASLIDLYEIQYGDVTGSIVRSEEYWRWLVGRKYAHVIWVACQANAVHGYAFVKDHKILEIACDPKYHQACLVLLARIRAEALERAYPMVVLHAPIGNPAIEIFRQPSGQIRHAADLDGQTSMYRISDPGRFLNCIMPIIKQRAAQADFHKPAELGVAVDGRHWLIKTTTHDVRVEPDKLGRRHLELTTSAFTQLALGHCEIDALLANPKNKATTAGALDMARALFPVQPLWRSPLDSGSA